MNMNDDDLKFYKDSQSRFYSEENIDIISMSATPIPRTLYMSLSGIKF